MTRFRFGDTKKLVELQPIFNFCFGQLIAYTTFKCSIFFSIKSFKISFIEWIIAFIAKFFVPFVEKVPDLSSKIKIKWEIPENAYVNMLDKNNWAIEILEIKMMIKQYTSYWQAIFSQWFSGAYLNRGISVEIRNDN